LLRCRKLFLALLQPGLERYGFVGYIRSLRAHFFELSFNGGDVFIFDFQFFEFFVQQSARTAGFALS
jgi:hypothetical protein